MPADLRWLPHPEYACDAALYRGDLLVGSTDYDGHRVRTDRLGLRGLAENGSVAEYWGWHVGRPDGPLLASGVADTEDEARRCVELVAEALGWLGIDGGGVGRWTEVDR